MPMTIDEKLERLTDAVLAHDAQIEALIQIGDRHEKVWHDLQRQWQAYINTLPKQ